MGPASRLLTAALRQHLAGRSGTRAARRPQPAASPGETWELRLYVTGRSPKYFQAIENLRLVCEQYLQGRYHIDVVDLLDNPRLAGYDQILAVPTAGITATPAGQHAARPSPLPMARQSRRRGLHDIWRHPQRPSPTSRRQASPADRNRTPCP